MPTRSDIVAEARSWINTPFHHQATLKGVGVDCAGLIRGILIDILGKPKDLTQWENSHNFLGYNRLPDGVKMLEACRLYLKEIPKEEMQPGDIVLVSFQTHPQHVGILGDYRHGGLSIIHSSSEVGKVVETRLMFTNSMKFVAAFSLPGIE